MAVNSPAHSPLVPAMSENDPAGSRHLALGRGLQGKSDDQDVTRFTPVFSGEDHVVHTD